MVKAGRPSPAQSRQIEREMLDVATSVFLAKGYSDASMDAVAAAARVSKATLYSRYPNKGALFAAVVEDRKEQWSAKVAQAEGMPAGTLEQRLRYLVASMLRWAVSSDVSAFNQLLATAPAEVRQPLYRSRYDSITDLLAAEIEAYTRAEGKPARNPRQVGFDLVILLAGWLHIQLNFEAPSEAKALRFGQHAVDVILSARATW
jgi:TetR/AcrR family transcriptional repressor of mexJK operon